MGPWAALSWGVTGSFLLKGGQRKGWSISSLALGFTCLCIHTLSTLGSMGNTRNLCLSCICCVCVLVVMHLCGDSKLPSKDREGDFPSSPLPGRSPESPFLCLLWFVHSDIQKAFWPEIKMARFLTKISKTQPSASAEV